MTNTDTNTQTTDTEVHRTPDGEFYTGTVDGHPFRFKTANRATAVRERDKALRQAAAWQAILDTLFPRP